MSHNAVSSGSNTLLRVKIAVGITLCLVFFLFTSITSDPDLGWHLAVGKWVVENSAVPHYDIYTHTMPGFEWVDHEWLIEAGMWWTKSHNLWWLMILFFTAFAFLPFAYWIKRSGSLSHLWIIALTAIATLNFVGMRPQTASFFLFFLLFEILRRKHKDAACGEINPKKAPFNYFLILPLLFLVWANLHGSFFIGFMLFGGFFTADHIFGWRHTGGIKKSRFFADLGLFGLCVGSTLVNPYGWKLHLSIIVATFSPETMRYISEWQPVFQTGSVSIAILLAIFLFLIFKFFGKYPRTILTTSLLFMVFSIKSTKLGPYFFVTAIPAMELGLQYAKSEIEKAAGSANFRARVGKKLYYIGVILYITIFAYSAYFAAAYGRVALTGLTSGQIISPVPQEAIETLRREVKSGAVKNLFNSYQFGGLLILEAPEVKVFIDGRMPHWIDDRGNSAMKDYVEVFYPKNGGWASVFEKYDIDTVFIEKKIKETPYPHTEAPSVIKDSDFLHRLNSLIHKGDQFDLGAVLIRGGWNKTYEDQTVLFLECHKKTLCWGENEAL